MRIRECVHCNGEFDLDSPQKKAAGGLVNQCSDCSEESTVKYAGVQAADGKQAQATILRFATESDKKRYLAFWQNNSGLHRGKVCSLGSHLSTTPDIKFSTVVDFTPTNHKGKAI